MVVKLIYYPPIQIPIDDTADASRTPPSVERNGDFGGIRDADWERTSPGSTFRLQLLLLRYVI